MCGAVWRRRPRTKHALNVFVALSADTVVNGMVVLSASCIMLRFGIPEDDDAMATLRAIHKVCDMLGIHWLPFLRQLYML